MPGAKACSRMQFRRNHAHGAELSWGCARADVDCFECTRSFNRKTGKLSAPPQWAGGEAPGAKKGKGGKAKPSPVAVKSQGAKTGFARCVRMPLLSAQQRRAFHPQFHPRGPIPPPLKPVQGGSPHGLVTKSIK